MQCRDFWQRFTSRPFLLSLVGALGTIAGNYYHAPPEVIAIYTAPLVAFILGESYRDGKAAQGEAASRAAQDRTPVTSDLIAVAKSAARDELVGHLGLSVDNVAPITLQSPKFHPTDAQQDESQLDDGLVINDDVLIPPDGNPNAAAVIEQERAFNG